MTAEPLPSQTIVEYFRLDPATDKWLATRDNSGGLNTTVFPKLRLPVNRMIGALVYPHLD